MTVRHGAGYPLIVAWKGTDAEAFRLIAGPIHASFALPEAQPASIQRITA
jgi:hypothetical protein